MKSVWLLAAMILLSTNSMAWDGYDQDGNSVEIEKGNLVREGLDIEVYNDGDNEYHNVTIDNITRSGNTVEIEGYDNDTDEYITLEMDD